MGMESTLCQYFSKKEIQEMAKELIKLDSCESFKNNTWKLTKLEQLLKKEFNLPDNQLFSVAKSIVREYAVKYLANSGAKLSIGDRVRSDLTKRIGLVVSIVDRSFQDNPSEFHPVKSLGSSVTIVTENTNEIETAYEWEFSQL